MIVIRFFICIFVFSYLGVMEVLGVIVKKTIEIPYMSDFDRFFLDICWNFSYFMALVEVNF